MFGKVLQWTLDDPQCEESLRAYNDVGDGVVLVALWSGGTAVLVWDGGGRIDVNLYTVDESQFVHTKFKTGFNHNFDDLELLNLEEQPRGYGRVVNFREDMKQPHGIRQQ